LKVVVLVVGLGDDIMSDKVMSPSQVHKRIWRIRDYSYIIPVDFIAKPNNSRSHYHLSKLHAVWAVQQNQIQLQPASSQSDPSLGPAFGLASIMLGASQVNQCLPS
jgi:hypothetical protein